MSSLMLHQGKKCIKNSDCSLYEVCRFGICEQKRRGDDCTFGTSKHDVNYCNYRNFSSQNLKCDSRTHTCVIKGGPQHGGDCTKDPFCHFTKFCNDQHTCEERVGLGKICNRNSHTSINNIYGNCRHPYICAPGCINQSSSATNECCVLPCFDDQDCKMLGKHSQCVQLPASHPNSNFFGYCQQSTLDDCDLIKSQPRNTWPIELSCKFYNFWTESCTLDSHCFDDEDICKNQRCVKRIMGDRCKVNTDCVAPFICHPTNKRCVPSTYLLPSQSLTCSSEIDCKFDHDCVNGDCVPKGNEGDRCDDTLCNDPFVCDLGVCHLPFHSDESECYSNSSFTHIEVAYVKLPDISTPAYLGICHRKQISPPTYTNGLSDLALTLIISGAVLLLLLIIGKIFWWRKKRNLRKRLSSKEDNHGGISEPFYGRDVHQSSMTSPPPHSAFSQPYYYSTGQAPIRNQSSPSYPGAESPSHYSHHYHHQPPSSSGYSNSTTIRDPVIAPMQSSYSMTNSKFDSSNAPFLTETDNAESIPPPYSEKK